jgi:hypothetical protein
VESEKVMIDVTELKKLRLALHRPATYHIRVCGPLETREAEPLHGLTISREDLARRPEVTTLHGELADQAALLRVLNHLLGLDVTLLSVEYLPEE